MATTGSQDKDHPAATGTASGPAARAKAYDPPTAFQTAGKPLPEAATKARMTAGGVMLEALPLTLYRSTVYIGAADGVTVVDGKSGLSDAIHPQGKLQDTSEFNRPKAFAPVLADAGDKDQVLAPFAITVPGTGTQPSRAKIELNAIDTATNKVTWRSNIDLPDWADESRAVAVRVVGVVGNTAVISASSQDNGVIYAFDLDKRAMGWEADHVADAVIAGDQVLAVQIRDLVRQRLAGFPMSGNGKPAWTKRDTSDLSLASAGPDLAVVSGTDYDSGDALVGFYRGDGSSAGSIDGDTFGLQCLYDGRSVTVCHTTMSDGRVFAVDSKTGKLLWQLPEKGSDRLVPTVTSAWHGIVYGETSNGPLLLDARTGADRADKPGIAPVAVNEFIGLALDDNDILNAHSASG
ncbi:PQQ-binding-like beta-propeller repeat protein [Streptomyces albiflavescens]|uniref:PQQ-binding-like beta-propeller repeat protein n=1 Tax=Streptomyces albiflavescens TaxID=1623582 RepID=UPI00166C6388|nr:PQQ-binding-like beta-propeller repeat protein [Streptomyces albiflavescens]